MNVRCLSCYPAERGVRGGVVHPRTPRDSLKRGDVCEGCGGMFLGLDTVAGARTVEIWLDRPKPAKVAAS